MSTATDTDPSDAFDIRPTKGESVPSKGMVSFARWAVSMPNKSPRVLLGVVPGTGLVAVLFRYNSAVLKQSCACDDVTEDSSGYWRTHEP